jgi:hypothetical protein
MTSGMRTSPPRKIDLQNTKSTRTKPAPAYTSAEQTKASILMELNWIELFAKNTTSGYKSDQTRAEKSSEKTQKIESWTLAGAETSGRPRENLEQKSQKKSLKQEHSA